MRRATTSVALALSLTALIALPVMAATVVVPNTNTVTPGPSNQVFPFGQGNMRYQQVFAANQLGGLVGPVTKIAYRVDEAFAAPSLPTRWMSKSGSVTRRPPRTP